MEMVNISDYYADSGSMKKSTSNIVGWFLCGKVRSMVPHTLLLCTVYTGTWWFSSLFLSENYIQHIQAVTATHSLGEVHAPGNVALSDEPEVELGVEGEEVVLLLGQEAQLQASHEKSHGSIFAQIGCFPCTLHKHLQSQLQSGGTGLDATI